MPPLFTEPGWNMHTAGGDRHRRLPGEALARRALPHDAAQGLWTHAKGGFYHDGRFATLDEVVDHYNGCFGLGLSTQQQADLVQYLKSL